MLITLEYHADLKEVQSDPALARLLGDEVQTAPFDRLAWWQGLAGHCGISPLLAVARKGDAIAVLPLAQGEGHLSALANWYSFRFRPIVSHPADQPRLLREIALALRQRARRVTLIGVCDEDGSGSAIATAFRAAGWVVFSDICDTNHILRLNGRSWAEYLASRPGQLRTTLKRKTGKVDTEVLTQFDAAAWAAYEEVYRQSWKSEEGSMAFLRAFAQAEGKAGRLRLGLARAEGRVIAAQMWTVEGDTAFIHKLAHIEEAKPLSPGSVLSAALFAHVIDRDRVAMIDFGTGDDPYKRDWMEEVRPRYRLDMLRPENPRNWQPIARWLLSRLARRFKHG